MIDTNKARWDLSKEEKYVINWFNEHGFHGEIVKQYVSKTKFIVSKNGVTDNFELQQGLSNMDIKKYMSQYEKQFDLLCELTKLRNQIDDR